MDFNPCLFTCWPHNKAYKKNSLRQFLSETVFTTGNFVKDNERIPGPGCPAPSLNSALAT